MKTYHFESHFPYPSDNVLFASVLDKANAYIAGTCPNRHETIAIPRTITYLRGLTVDYAERAKVNQYWVCDHSTPDEEYRRDPSTCTAEEWGQHWDAWQTNATLATCCDLLINEFMKIVTEVCDNMTVEEFKKSKAEGRRKSTVEEFLRGDVCDVDTTPRDTIEILYAREDHPDCNGCIKPLYYHDQRRCDAVLVYVPADTPTEHPSTENPRFAVWDDAHKDLGYAFVDVCSKLVYRQTEDRRRMDPLVGVKVLSVIKGVLA